jgi:hypothetical protein
MFGLCPSQRSSKYLAKVAPGLEEDSVAPWETVQAQSKWQHLVHGSMARRRQSSRSSSHPSRYLYHWRIHIGVKVLGTTLGQLNRSILYV